MARTYKALKRFADLQGPICYNDAQNKGISLIVYEYIYKWAYGYLKSPLANYYV